MSRKRLGSLEECVYCKKYKHYKSIKRHEKTCPKNIDNSELERLRIENEKLRKQVALTNEQEFVVFKSQNKELLSENMKLSDELKRLSKIEEDALRFKELLLKNPPKRPGITYKRKLELVIKQKGVCNLCNNELEENNYDFDHKIPWSQSFDNSDGNIQILCLTCHRKKQ